jgi:hypothetical protein
MGFDWTSPVRLRNTSSSTRRFKVFHQYTGEHPNLMPASQQLLSQPVLMHTPCQWFKRKSMCETNACAGESVDESTWITLGDGESTDTGLRVGYNTGIFALGTNNWIIEVEVSACA